MRLLSPLEDAEAEQMFGEHTLALDAEAETHRLCSELSAAIRKRLHRRGAVVGVSGGIDSAVVLALCARALGPGSVVAVMMPEIESEPSSAQLASRLATGLGVRKELEDITAALTGLRCYERRDAAIRQIMPEYDTALGYRAKITLPGLLDQDTLNVFSLTVIRPDGSAFHRPLSGHEMREIMSA